MQARQGSEGAEDVSSMCKRLVERVGPSALRFDIPLTLSYGSIVLYFVSICAPCVYTPSCYARVSTMLVKNCDARSSRVLSSDTRSGP